METAQTADYALLALLELEQSGRQTIAELALSLNLNRTVTQRTLVTLHARGFVIRDLDGRYGVGPTLLSISQGLPDEVATISEELLKDFAQEIQETAIVAVPRGDEIVIVAAEAASSSPLRVECEVGFRQPISVGATGLAILAHTKGNPAAKQLGAIEQAIISESLTRGYARTSGQVRADMTGVAAPLLDSSGLPFGALAIIVPSIRAARLDTLIDPLLSTARGIESQYAASQAESAHPLKDNAK